MQVAEPSESRGQRPWEIARADAALRILGPRSRRVGRMLDFAGGDGFTGQRLFAALGGSAYFGYDARLSQAECEQRSHGPLHFVNKLGSEAHDFDLVLLCDALEHAPDDRVLLREARARVHESGRVLVMVPAFEELFTDRDRELLRYRRYDLDALCDELAAVGLPVKDSGHLFGSLLGPRAASRMAEVLRAIVPRERAPRPTLTNKLQSKLRARLQTSAFELENRALLRLNQRGVKLPGLTAWALCDLRDPPVTERL